MPRTRLYRNGVLEAEGFPIAEVSDHLADPTATVLSVGLLLEHLGRADQARKVNAAVAFDLSTREPQGKARTAEVGDRLAALAGG